MGLCYNSVGSTRGVRGGTEEGERGGVRGLGNYFPAGVACLLAWLAGACVLWATKLFPSLSLNQLQHQSEGLVHADIRESLRKAI